MSNTTHPPPGQDQTDQGQYSQGQYVQGQYGQQPYAPPPNAFNRRYQDEELAKYVSEGMLTLRQDGLRLCLEGVSSLAEIRRVTGDRG